MSFINALNLASEHTTARRLLSSNSPMTSLVHIRPHPHSPEPFSNFWQIPFDHSSKEAGLTGVALSWFQSYLVDNRNRETEENKPKHSCPPWSCAAHPGYLNLFFILMHTAEQCLLCMLVLWKFKSEVASPHSPFKVHNLKLFPTCAAGLPRLRGVIVWRRNRELALISSHKNTQKGWQATGSKLSLPSPSALCRISIFHFFLLQTFFQWISLSLSKLTEEFT